MCSALFCAHLLMAVVILPLGDSMTTGCQDVTQLDRASYRIPLQDRLREAGTPFDFVGRSRNQCFTPSYDNDHGGYAGITVEGLTEAARILTPQLNPDVVLLLVGSNNHDDPRDYEQFLGRYSELLDTLGGRRIFAATIPRFGERSTPSSWSGEWLKERNDSWIPTMNRAIRAAAAMHPRVKVVDLYASLDPARHLLDDGIHPNTAGQLLLADLFWEAAFAHDLDASGMLDPADIDLLTRALHVGATEARYDIDRDGVLTIADRDAWLRDVMQVRAGDANMDGRFGSSDLVLAWADGHYETSVVVGWQQGDWNGDLVFDSKDLVAAWVHGRYEPQSAATAARSVPEPDCGPGVMALAWMIARTFHRAPRVAKQRR